MIFNLPSVITYASEPTTRKSQLSLNKSLLPHPCSVLSADLVFCRNIDNLGAFGREKCFRLTAAFEKLTYTDAGTNAPSKDLDQVCLMLSMMMTMTIVR